MFNDPDHCYQALASHDERFDGRFFVGVRTTGIYCRPVCRVRLPRRENCTFYPSAAAAETQGFRPCLRCRPELAPGWSTTDIEERLAHAGSRLIEAGTVRISQVALRLGVSERHFRRIFLKAFGVTPSAWRQTQRLLLAKQLLTDTSMSVLDVALAAGFGSVRRLNATLQSRYGLTPTRMRHCRHAPVAAAVRLPEQVTLRLSVHAPHATAELFTTLAAHAIPGLEWGDAGGHARVLSVQGASANTVGILQARGSRAGDHVVLSLSASLLPVVTQVLAIAKDLYDVNADPVSLARSLGSLASRNPGLRVPGIADGFEAVVRLLVEAALPAVEARRSLTALVRGAGSPVRAGTADMPPGSGLSHAFPDAETLQALDRQFLLSCGFAPSLAESVQGFASVYLTERIDLSAGACVDDTLALLARVPGMHQTVLDRIALHVLRWPDAFPASDPQLQARLGVSTRKQALSLAEAWRPWRAYAAMHLLHDSTERPLCDLTGVAR